MNVVKFKYYDDFHCIGPDCPDTCCQGWSIYFGKRDYLKYKNVKCSQKLKDRLSGAFVRIRDHEKRGLVYDEGSNYAEIKFNEEGYCPLLDSDGLCMMQKELGEKALGHVCDIYPRLKGSVGGEAVIYACNITCPHVIDVLINHPEGLEIVEEENDSESASKEMYNFNISKDWNGYPYFWVIKGAQLDILQNRSFTIPERLLILGFFSKKADEYIGTGQGEKIEGLHKMLLDKEFCQKIANSLKPSQSDENILAKSVDIFSQMLSYARDSEASEKFKKLFEKAADSIDLKRTVKSDGERQDRVETTCDKDKFFKNVGIFRSIESERSYIIENILVNLTLVQAPKGGLFKNFFSLALFYNAMKISIPALLEGNRTDKDLALAFANSAKMIINLRFIEEEMTYFFHSSGSFDLPHAAFLIG